jgi:DNA uptake protein ComE-like DNA-binding protein
MPKKSPFFVSTAERTGVMFTLLALCIFKIVEPTMIRLKSSAYERPMEWKVSDTLYISEVQKASKSNAPVYKTPSNNQPKEWNKLSSPKKYTSHLGDINTADTTKLKRIYGVGSVLAKRIVKYRKYLGHFVAMEQLEEVYHLPDSVGVKLKSQFSLDTNPLYKIAINRASKEELSALPYLSSQEIDWILEVRRTRGEFRTEEDLTNLFVKSLNKKPFILLYLTL